MPKKAQIPSQFQPVLMLDLIILKAPKLILGVRVIWLGFMRGKLQLSETLIHLAIPGPL